MKTFTVVVSITSKDLNIKNSELIREAVQSLDSALAVDNMEVDTIKVVDPAYTLGELKIMGVL